MSNKFGVIGTDGVQVLLWTRKTLDKGNNYNMEQDRVSAFVHYVSLQETCTASLESFQLTLTKLYSGQDMHYKI